VTARQNPYLPGARYVAPHSVTPIFTARNDVRFLSQAVQPPSQVYVESTDVLRIAAASSQVNEVLTVSWRLLLPSGDIVLNQASLAVPATRTIAIHDEPLAEGFLLSVSCKAAAATTRGQTFARIFLTDPDLGTGQPSYMLMADYVTTAMAPAHPSGRVAYPVEGPGWIRQLSIGNPAPGAEFIITVPTNARWRLQGLEAILSTSIAAANRQMTLRAFGGVTIVFQSIQGFVEAASLSETYIFAPQMPVSNLPGLTLSTAPIPYGHFLSANNGDTLNSQTVNLQAADQYSFVQIGIEEWLENV
jgi:hypothetical protein